LRVALFVEGSLGERRRDGGDWFEELWLKVIPGALGVRRAERVVPINKKHLVALDPAIQKLRSKTSGTSVGIDELIAAELRDRPFDAAVVAWDLQPPWDPEATPCRWQETLWLYEALASNSSLPPIWQRWARDRITELRARDVPSERASVPVLQEGAVLAVCMDPMFEGLMRHEDGVRHTLGLRAKQVKNWPTGWNTAKNPKRLLQKAIVAARDVRPMPDLVRKIRGDMETAAHEWGCTFLTPTNKVLLDHARSHPIAARLRQLLLAGG